MMLSTRTINSDLIARGREAAKLVDDVSKLYILHYVEDTKIASEKGITIEEFVSLTRRYGISTQTIGLIKNGKKIDLNPYPNIEQIYSLDESIFYYLDVVSEANSEFRLVSPKEDMQSKSLPVLSVALFAAVISDKLDWIVDSEVICTYISILHGKRAPKGFWQYMTDNDLYLVSLFETLFLSNIFSYETAKTLSMRDRIFCVYPLPRKNRESLSLYECACTVADMEVFDMRHMPRNITADATFYTRAVERCLEYYQITIDELTNKMVKQMAPAALLKIGGLKNLKTFYKNHNTHFEE